ncbi:MAG: two-component regulator propeller domain-containing protein, partial [Bacteroidota bacterium]
MKSYRYPIKHILTLIIGIIASYYGGGKLYGQDYEIIKVTTENGLSHSTVFDITQDGNGLMWFGTREGLNRFDSNEIKTFYKEDSEGLPSNLITSLLYAKNILWVGTDKGLSKYHISKDVFEPIPQLNDSYVMNLFQSSNSEIFISTQKGFYKIEEDGNLKTLVKDGFFNSVIEYRTDVFLTVSDRSIRMTNSKGEVIKYYELNAKSPKKSQSGRVAINKLFKDSKGFIWAGTTKGLFQYDQKNDSFKKSNLIDQKGGPETKVIRNIVEDHEGNLYFGGEAGIIVVNPKKSIRTHIGQGFQIPNTLSDKAVYSLFISKNNIVWAGTYFGGVNYFKPKGNAFKRLIPSEFKNSISGKAISQMIQVENGDLWIGTEDGGISILDKKTNTFKYLRNNPNYSQSLSSDNVHALYEDFDGTIWAGTFLGGLNKIDPNTKKGKVFTYDPKDTQSISSNYIYAIYRDSKERLWIGANDGLNLFDDSTETFDRNVHPELMDKFIYDILEDRDNNLWFCTRSNGLYMLENKSNQWKHFSQNLSNGTGVCSDQFVTAYEDSFGKLWFGTMDGGLLYYNKAAESFECFGKKKGLPNNNIYGIIENPSGGLWVTTNKGLSLYNPESGKSRDYTTADGISYNQFNFKSSFMDKEGWIYFGSVNGLTYFHPDSVQTPNRTSMIFLKDFLLFNEPVSITKDSPLQFSINETKNITLEHFQNALTIEFIGVDYLSKGKNSYSYMLEGFDNSWNNVGDKKNATYTNLPFGEYEFHLKLANNEPEGSSRSLAINILPPFWKTNWAYALYFLTLTLIAYGTYYFVRFVQAKNLAVKLEKVENEKIREITKNRLNFFTFISHEFKTPLTLINAAIDQYSNKGSIPGEAANEIQYIQRSAKKLNHLVKQLMMFRKIETKHEKLNLVKGDIILYLRDTFSAFRPLFTSRGLKSSFSSNIEQYYCHFDGHKIETIISNLLSNSIKNTEGEGEISMDLDVTPAPN